MNLEEEIKTAFGVENGEFVHFDFYSEAEEGGFTPKEAYKLQWKLINFLRSEGYSFDGGAKLGVWPKVQQEVIRVP